MNIPPHVLERVFGFLSSLADIANLFVVNRSWNNIVRNGVYKCLERQRWTYAFVSNYIAGKNWMDIDWEKEFSMFLIFSYSSNIPFPLVPSLLYFVLPRHYSVNI